MWQELIDAGISEADIERRLVEGISLEEQVAELRAEYDAS
jgi:hypothetical protein